jgi:hypothetical protein
MSTAALRLSTLLRQLDAAGFDVAELPYRKLWEFAVRGMIPAHQETGRWHYLPADVPVIASAIGLRRKAKPATRASTRIPATAA